MSNESGKMLISICRGYIKLGVSGQRMLGVLMESGGRFEGGYTKLGKLIGEEPTNVRKTVLRIIKYGIVRVEFAKSKKSSPMVAMELADDWVLVLENLGKDNQL